LPIQAVGKMSENMFGYCPKCKEPIYYIKTLGLALKANQAESLLDLVKKARLEAIELCLEILMEMCQDEDEQDPMSFERAHTLREAISRIGNMEGIKE
jgi:hypothetical protein